MTRWGCFGIAMILPMLGGCSPGTSNSAYTPSAHPNVFAAATSVPVIPATITAYDVKPPDRENFALAVGPDGALWFTQLDGGGLGRIFPPSKAKPSPKVRLFSVAGVYGTASLDAAPDGSLWFSGDGPTESLGRISLQPAAVKPKYLLFSLPSGQDADGGLAVGPEGAAVWFGSITGNAIGRMNIPRPSASPKFTFYPLPTPSSQPWSLVFGKDRALWFTEFNNGKIGRLTLDGTLTELALDPGAYPTAIVVGPDGAMWYADTGLSQIGRIDRKGRTVFRIPRGQQIGNPRWLTVGPDSALWFTSLVENGAVGRMTLDGKFSKLIKGFSVAQGIATGPDGAVWVVDSKSKIIRIQLEASTRSIRR